MQISAINPVGYNFKGSYDEPIDAEYTVMKPTEHNSSSNLDYGAVANVLDHYGANKVTSPGKFFLASLACAAAAFLASRAAVGGALNKLDNKFGIFESAGRKVSTYLVDLSKKHPIQEGKGFKIFFNNQLHDLGKMVAKYGQKGLSADAVKAAEAGIINPALAANATKRGLSAGIGTGVGLYTVQNRYQDSDQNGVPDKAEGKLSLFEEAAALIPALVDASGL